MSVLSEKNAVKAAFITILTGAVVGTTSANVMMYVIPNANTVWPALVVTRVHWALTELYAGGQKGNADSDPNLYDWEYHDQLVSITGSTVEATMDAHDVFLEAMAVYFQSPTGYYLADGGGVRQVLSAGESLRSDAHKEGPYNMLSGSDTLVSSGVIAVKSLNRAPLP